MFYNTTKNNSLVAIFLFVLASSQVSAKSMICAIPVDNRTNTESSESYIELLEPKTNFQFNISNRIKNFTSPGCHKIHTISFWMNSIEISCGSNAGESINLKIDLSTLKFSKTYSKKTKEINSFSGFCLTAT
jgi:hypothetical protein